MGPDGSEREGDREEIEMSPVKGIEDRGTGSFKKAVE